MNQVAGHSAAALRLSLELLRPQKRSPASTYLDCHKPQDLQSPSSEVLVVLDMGGSSGEISGPSSGRLPLLQAASSGLLALRAQESFGGLGRLGFGCFFCLPPG